MQKRVQGADGMQVFAGEYIQELAAPSRSFSAGKLRLGAATVVALSGELGAGKTTFAQGAARALGVDEQVTSPTFVIEKIYALADQKFARLVHIDAYRLKTADELRALGWDELIAENGNLIIIEWPENVPEAIPLDAKHISIAIGEGEERTINYDG